MPPCSPQPECGRHLRGHDQPLPARPADRADIGRSRASSQRVSGASSVRDRGGRDRSVSIARPFCARTRRWRDRSARRRPAVIVVRRHRERARVRAPTGVRHPGRRRNRWSSHAERTRSACRVIVDMRREARDRAHPVVGRRHRHRPCRAVDCRRRRSPGWRTAAACAGAARQRSSAEGRPGQAQHRHVEWHGNAVTAPLPSGERGCSCLSPCRDRALLSPRDARQPSLSRRRLGLYLPRLSSAAAAHQPPRAQRRRGLRLYRDAVEAGRRAPQGGRADAISRWCSTRAATPSATTCTTSTRRTARRRPRIWSRSSR